MRDRGGAEAFLQTETKATTFLDGRKECGSTTMRAIGSRSWPFFFCLVGRMEEVRISALSFRVCGFRRGQTVLSAMETATVAEMVVGETAQARTSRSTSLSSIAAAAVSCGMNETGATLAATVAVNRRDTAARRPKERMLATARFILAAEEEEEKKKLQRLQLLLHRHLSTVGNSRCFARIPEPRGAATSDRCICLLMLPFAVLLVVSSLRQSIIA